MKKPEPKLKPDRDFERDYWRTNYAEPQDMDGIFNAKQHAGYLKHFFDLEHVAIKSMIDLGCGFGHLLAAMHQCFRPRTVAAIEPSAYAFARAHKRLSKLTPKVSLHQQDVLTWARAPWVRKTPYDLALCTSVMQYIDDKALHEIIPAIAQRARFLYLTVPTDIEFVRIKQDYFFEDPWAIARPQHFYLDLLRPHFTIVGQRILESKIYYSSKNTPINEQLFRF